jgi:hypothetical protein
MFFVEKVLEIELLPTVNCRFSYASRPSACLPALQTGNPIGRIYDLYCGGQVKN